MPIDEGMEHTLATFRVDTSKVEKDLSTLPSEFDKMGNRIKLSTQKIMQEMKVFGSGVEETFVGMVKEVTTNVLALENGMQRIQKTIRTLDKSRSTAAPGGQIYTTRLEDVDTKSLEGQLVLLDQVKKEWAEVTNQKKQSVKYLEQYSTELKKIAALNPTSSIGQEATHLSNRADQQIVEKPYRSIIDIEKQRSVIQREMLTALQEEQKILRQKDALYQEQLTYFNTIIDKYREIGVAEELVTQHEQQRLSLNREYLQTQERIASQNNARAALEQQRVDMSIINQLENERYVAQQKNIYAAKELAEMLSLQQKRIINNGTFTGKLANSVLYGTSAMLQGEIWSTLHDGMSSIKEFEQGIVDLRRTIQGVTENELKQFGETAISYAKQYGLELKDVQDAMTELARAGVDDSKNLKNLTETVSIGLNTTEIETADEMVGYLISTIKQLDMSMEDSMEIIDTWNYLADQYAVHTDDFAKAIQRAGSASKNFGLDLYDINAMVTILGEATQASGENIGTAIRSMEVRLLRPETIRTLESYGIAVKKNEKEFLSFQEIMNNVNEVIKDMDDNSITLSKIMDAMGGSWRKNWITTLTSDWERFDELVVEQQNNIGYSAIENEKAMDTVGKKMMQLKQSWIELFVDTANQSGLTEDFKDLIDNVSDLMELFNNSKVPELAVDLLKVAAAGAALKLAIDGVAKTIGSDFRLSIDTISKQLDKFGLNLYSKEAAARKLMESIQSLSDENGETVSLEQQLEVAQAIDRRIGTNTSSSAQARVNIQNLQREVDLERQRLQVIVANQSALGRERSTLERLNSEDRIQRLNSELALQNTVLQRNQQSLTLNSQIRAMFNRTTIAATAAQTALNTVLFAGIGILVSFVAKGIYNYIKAADIAIEKVQDLANTHNSTMDSFDNNIQTIESLKDRFEKLSIGVNKYGENISLTTDEYDEYKKIIEQINQISPGFLDGLNDQNEAMYNQAGALDDLIDRQNELARLESSTYISKNKSDIANGRQAEYDKNMKEYDVYVPVVTRTESNKMSIGSDSAKEYNKILESVGIESVPNISDTVNMPAYMEILKEDAKTTKEIYDNRMDILQVMKDSGLYQEETLQRYAEEMDGLKAYLDAQKEIKLTMSDELETVAKSEEAYYKLSDSAKKFLSLYIQNSFDESKFKENFTEYEKSVREVTRLLSENNGAQDIASQLMNVDKAELTIDEYLGAVDNGIDKLSSMLNIEDKDSLKLTFGIDIDEEQIEHLRQKMHELFGVESDELLKNNSFKSIAELNNVIEKFDLQTADEIIEFLKNIGMYSEDNGFDLNGSILDSIGDLNDISDLSAAMELAERYIQNAKNAGDDFGSSMENAMARAVSAVNDFNGAIDASKSATQDAANSVSDWVEKSNEIRDMDKNSREYYDTMAEIAAQYPELVVGTDKVTGAIKLQDGALTEIGQRYVDNFNQEKANAIAEAEMHIETLEQQKEELQAQIDENEAMKTSSENRINGLADTATTSIDIVANASSSFLDSAANVLDGLPLIGKGIASSMRNMSKNVLGGAEGGKSKVSDAYNRFLDFNADRNNKQNEELQSQIDAIDAAIAGESDRINILNNIKPYTGSGSSKKSKTKSESAIEEQDVVEAYINQVNLQVKKDNLLSDQLEKQMKLAELTADESEQIKLSNEYYSNMVKTIDDIAEANKQLEDKKKELAAGSGYDPTGWFDELGNDTMAYMELLNSFAGKTDDASKKAQQAIIDLHDQWEKLNKQIKANTDSISELNQKMIQQAYNSAKEYIQQQKENDLLQAELNYKQRIADLETSVYGTSKKEYTQSINDRVESIRAEIDAMNDVNAAKKEQEEREEKILNIQKLQEELANTIANKNVRLYKRQDDGTWQYEYVADPEKVKDLQDELKDAQKEYDDWEKDKADEKYKQQLEDEIDALNDMLSAKNEYYEEMAADYKKAYDTEKQAIEYHYRDIDKLTRKYMQTLMATYGEQWDEILKVLEEKLSAARAMNESLLALANMNQNLNASISTNVISGGGVAGGGEVVYPPIKNGGNDFAGVNLNKHAQYIEDTFPGGLDAYVTDLVTSGKDQSRIDAELKRLDIKKAYASGGVADFTGKAILHGTQDKSEVIFNSGDAKKLYDLIHGSTTTDLQKNIINDFMVPLSSLPSLPDTSELINATASMAKQSEENVFHIDNLTFPNITTPDGLQKAILDLPRIAMQYKKR